MAHLHRTFSQTYPSHHPQVGERTFFVEKVWNYLWQNHGLSFDFDDIVAVNPTIDRNILWAFWDERTLQQEEVKNHTIRGGHHFKPGDILIPKIWIGRPYHSKQIQIAPPIQIKKTWRFEIKNVGYYLDGRKLKLTQLKQVALNDGLEVDAFECWFNIKKDQTFDGQIICWNENINYNV